MPDFSMICPHCNSPINNIPEEKDGQIITCMECGKTLQAVSSAAPEEKIKVADSDIILGDKVSDSDMDGFESFEAPEEEEIEEAELIRIRVPWRTTKFMTIVCDILFLIVALELAFCAYLIYQAHVKKTELPQKFAAERKEMENKRKSAQDRLARVRKNIREQITKDEKEESVYQGKMLQAEIQKVKNTKIQFPEKIDPASKPFLKENPFLFYLTALNTYKLVDEDTRRTAVLELTLHLKNILEEIKDQRKYDRVAVIEEVIEPFQKGGVDLSEVAIAAKAVTQFEKDEKIRLAQEAKDKVRREKERAAALERQRREALERISNYKEQLSAATRQLYTVEDKFNFPALRPHAAQSLFARVCFEHSRNADGSLVPVETLLKYIAGTSDIKISRAEATKICSARFKSIEDTLASKYSVAAVRKAAEKKALELYPEIKRGENVTVVYLDASGKSYYSYRGAFARSERNGVNISGRIFAWDRLEAECRKKLDPQARTQARADYVKSMLDKLQKKVEQERTRLRNIASQRLFQSGIVVEDTDIYSTESFIRKHYPAVKELNEVRLELERILTNMYPVCRAPVKPEAKAFVAGLQSEFGLKEHSNTGKAINFYEKAAKLNSLEAQLRLGDMYSAPQNTTRGIKRNIPRALMYYRMAEKQNNEYARACIKKLTAAPAKEKDAKDKDNNKK